MAEPFLFGRVHAAALIRELHGISRNLPANVRQADASTAADVGARARLRARGLGGVHAHVAPGIVDRGSVVGLDVNDQAAILGAEFGGGARPRTRQFPPWRGSGADAGYMLYPTLREEATMRRYEEILDDIID
jgi:hypothetical protein